MRIGIVGAGTMGSGIAQVAATAGHEVVLQDIAEPILQKAKGGIEKSLRKLSEKGKLQGDPGTIVARIGTTTKLEDFAECDFVVEAALEEFAVKERLFGELDRICQKAAVLGTNTSSISITRIAACTKRPERVIGMHFMNPVPLMQLVEVIRGYKTSDAAYKATEELAKGMGKTPVEVNDSAGFVSNRVLLPMINEAAFALYEGVGTAEAIDTVMKLGMNHPMGPLALADLIGLDVCLNILNVLHEEFKDPKYRPCPLLVKMVRAGDLGRKTGRGFFPYEPK
jgi:3-hydroxybutyryl-CoA dehydrogenase